ncbi:ribosome silencing factor [Ramlibacter sp.]|uniref:ribosome silencing factor n=1 Tax=Ramlibacter sp. TaxID=1917967 RepID=UPI001855F6F7|nr:ribosome silencing factor [Ramlibacter sp.]MBA2676207.1 ribosome silencing factor [Ramlibacter sp.]
MSTEATAKKDTQKLQRAIVDGLEDVKAQDIQVFNTEHLSPLFERVIVASGTSNRQTKALASSVVDAVREAGFPKPRIEGQENGEWIIVDCGAAVAHIMQPAIRQYYHLEEIWGDKPVRLRLGAPLPAAAPPKPEPAAKTAKPNLSLRRSSAVKTAARDAKREADAAKKQPPRKTGAKSAAVKAAGARPPAKKAAARSPAPAAKKAAPAKRVPTKTVPAKKAPAKKAAAKKTAPRGR